MTYITKRRQRLEEYRDAWLILNASAEDGGDLPFVFDALAIDPHERPDKDLPIPEHSRWVPYVLWWMDGAFDGARWSNVMGRLVALSDRLVAMSPEDSLYLDMACRRIAVAAAEPYDMSGSCAAALALIDRALAGDKPTRDEWLSALRTGRKLFAGPGGTAADWAVHVIFWLARVAVRPAESYMAAEKGAMSAVAAVVAAEEVRGISSRAKARAKAAAASKEMTERMIDEMLTAMEKRLAV
jgi:hypothetical protein